MVDRVSQEAEEETVEEPPEVKPREPLSGMGVRVHKIDIRCGISVLKID